MSGCGTLLLFVTRDTQDTPSMRTPFFDSTQQDFSVMCDGKTLACSEDGDDDVIASQSLLAVYNPAYNSYQTIKYRQ